MNGFPDLPFPLPPFFQGASAFALGCALGACAALRPGGSLSAPARHTILLPAAAGFGLVTLLLFLRFGATPLCAVQILVCLFLFLLSGHDLRSGLLPGGLLLAASLLPPLLFLPAGRPLLPLLGWGLAGLGFLALFRAMAFRFTGREALGSGDVLLGFLLGAAALDRFPLLPGLAALGALLGRGLSPRLLRGPGGSANSPSSVPDDLPDRVPFVPWLSASFLFLVLLP